MNSKIARTIILSVITLALVASVSAGPHGWHNYRFIPRTAVNDASGATYANAPVDFWVQHNGNASGFTIYKPNVGGLRVYIVIEGVSWAAFKQYMIFGSSAGGFLTMPDGKLIPFGGIDMTKLEGHQTKVTIDAKMSGEFTKLYYKQPTISVRVIGQPGQTIGNEPDVDVDVKGGVINVVKVDYPRGPLNAAGVITPGNLGTVTVDQNGGGGRFSLINAVNVRGGKIGNCNAEKGINQLICKGRRYKKVNIAGGSITGTCKTDGKIKKIYASNGLDGKITSGEDLSPNGISKVVAVRGGNGAIITAGGTQGSAIPIGTIGKITVNLKKYGQYTTLNNCKFHSYGTSKVKLNKKNVTFANIIGCDVITPNATYPIDATYPNLK